ncbi:MAG: ABC transporter substrate-binding protein [Rhizobiales bacterium]|nr:ABC transporter substrate-binding protein [Hyphomicrobiales bacterium]MBO6699186.1 ABC transporter substrate-binding protein [Hyphomicrobiales bacterium]MBO6736724.1 ABC transporter substrate-binding protein [Hyphomicrobiales bacterium]MBO6912202.1 ABC transporter substrate-binding protein [Hyphomicrobiales bacterium]MBO6956697.1 ABC transporter substrate-binding protein [Hyphomicrobiales bacterium]
MTGSTALRSLVLSAALLGAAPASADSLADFDALADAARGETVFFHAWSGDPTINAYIEWAGDEIEARFGIEVEHVRVTDTADVVGIVLAETAAGRDSGGSVDLVWINGENFIALKDAGLLYAPDDEGWAHRLPNWELVDVAGNPSLTTDFTVPVEGFQAPWGTVQFSFYYDSEAIDETPSNLDELLTWAEANPGRFTYPQPPNFLGSTFLKLLLAYTIDDRDRLGAPLPEQEAEEALAPLFAYLDELHPHLWRSGRTFPANQAALRQLFGDGEIVIGFANNPAEASGAIARDEFPASTRSFVLDDGMIANSHFVAIPSNANAPQAALVVANFLMSPIAQLRKQDPAVWGDFTVLDIAALDQNIQDGFAALDLGPATLTPSELGPAISEPHTSWLTAIEAMWAARYQGG